MKSKYGKWYADWIDETGHRRAKALPTKKAALKHQQRMRNEVAAKKAHASDRSGTSARHGQKPSRKRTTKRTPSLAS